MVIDGIQSFASGAVTVASGATLKGIGTIGGDTYVSGTHAPGIAQGTQKFTGNLQYQSASIFEWTLDSTASGRGTGYDGVNVGGALSGSDAVLRIVLQGNQTFSDPFWNQARTWTDIFTAANGTSAINWTAIFSRPLAYFNAGGQISHIQGSFSFTSGTTLSWSPVPEPGNLLVGLLIGAGLFRRRRM